MSDKPAVPSTPLPWAKDLCDLAYTTGADLRAVLDQNDIRFISEACNAYPRLIEERERLREALGNIEAKAHLASNAVQIPEIAKAFALIEVGAHAALASLEKDNG